MRLQNQRRAVRGSNGQRSDSSPRASARQLRPASSLRGRTGGATFSADADRRCQKQHFSSEEPPQLLKTASRCEDARRVTARDPFAQPESARIAIQPDGGPVLRQTGLLTWVRFDVVHLVEIFRDEKLLQTNTHERNTSQTKQPPSARGCLKESEQSAETRKSSPFPSRGG